MRGHDRHDQDDVQTPAHGDQLHQGVHRKVRLNLLKPEHIYSWPQHELKESLLIYFLLSCNFGNFPLSSIYNLPMYLFNQTKPDRLLRREGIAELFDSRWYKYLFWIQIQRSRQQPALCGLAWSAEESQAQDGWWQSKKKFLMITCDVDSNHYPIIYSQFIDSASEGAGRLRHGHGTAAARAEAECWGGGNILQKMKNIGVLAKKN